jgi:cysteine desulfurase
VKSIYLDHAATTPLYPEVKKVIISALEEFQNPSSLHALGKNTRATYQRHKVNIASYFGVTAEQTVITGSGSEADNLAIRGICLANRGLKNHLITTMIEHPAVLNTMNAMRKLGFKVTFVPVPENGQVLASAIEKAITPETLLVSVMSANNETGVLQPIEEIGKICRRHDVYFHVDAVQSVPYQKFDLSRDPIDLLSIAAHKFNGPKGVGALLMSRQIKLEPLMTGGLQENGLRPGTENLPAVAGMAKALEMAYQNFEMKSVENLRNNLESQILKNFPGSKINGDIKNRNPHVLNIFLPEAQGEKLLDDLSEQGIYISTGAACASGKKEPSHVLLAMGLAPEQARSSIRISLGTENTEQDIFVFLEGLARCLKKN